MPTNTAIPKSPTLKATAPRGGKRLRGGRGMPARGRLKADLFLIGFCVFYLASNFSSSLCPSYSISATTAR